VSNEWGMGNELVLHRGN